MKNPPPNEYHNTYPAAALEGNDSAEPSTSWCVRALLVVALITIAVVGGLLWLDLVEDKCSPPPPMDQDGGLECALRG